jgi:peroxiredoxin
MDLLATPTKGKINVIVVGILAIIALAGGIGAYFYLNQPADKPKIATIKDDTLVGKRRPDFSLQDVDGKQRTLSEWDGKVLIVNFWATWCPPCRREIPAFIELMEHYESKGFAIIGVALDDRQAAVDFVDPMGINYPVLIADVDGIAISQQYGNKLGVLPFTVIVDRKGIIRHSLAREVEKEEAEKLILPLLSQN